MRNGKISTLTTRRVWIFLLQRHDIQVIDVRVQELKHILKPMISEDPNTPPTDKMEETFIAAIMKEIDRVDTFFTFQENQFYAEFRSLCQKVLYR